MTRALDCVLDMQSFVSHKIFRWKCITFWISGPCTASCLSGCSVHAAFWFVQVLPTCSTMTHSVIRAGLTALSITYYHQMSTVRYFSKYFFRASIIQQFLWRRCSRRSGNSASHAANPKRHGWMCALPASVSTNVPRSSLYCHHAQWRSPRVSVFESSEFVWAVCREFTK